MFIKTQTDDIINTDKIQTITTHKKPNGLWKMVAFFGGGEYCIIWDDMSPYDVFDYQKQLENIIGVITLEELIGKINLYEDEEEQD